MQLSGMPSKFSLAWAKNALGSLIRTPPVPSQIGITPGAASFNDGFPPITFLSPLTAGGIPPSGQDMNGILNLITSWNQWQQAGGTVQYDSTFSGNVTGYPNGAILASSATAGLYWVNVADNNTTNPDSGGAANWLPWGPANGRGYYFGTDSGTAANVATVSATTPAFPSVASLTTGTLFIIKKNSTAANTGSVSVTLAGTSIPVRWASGSALSNGQWSASTPALFEYDGTYLNLMSVLVSGSSGLTNIQVITASGTYTPTTGAQHAIAIATGGGGAGGSGGTDWTGGAGGAGATAIAFISSLSPMSVTIGAGGSAPSGSGTNGGAGGTTTLGSVLSAGGGGASHAGYWTADLGGDGGTATVGTVLIRGGAGCSGAAGWSGSGGSGVCVGGSSFWGGGGSQISNVLYLTQGQDGRAYGSGGGGTGGASSSAGSNGAAGVVLILEF